MIQEIDRGIYIENKYIPDIINHMDMYIKDETKNVRFNMRLVNRQEAKVHVNVYKDKDSNSYDRVYEFTVDAQQARYFFNALKDSDNANVKDNHYGIIYQDDMCKVIQYEVLDTDEIATNSKTVHDHSHHAVNFSITENAEVFEIVQPPIILYDTDYQVGKRYSFVVSSKILQGNTLLTNFIVEFNGESKPYYILPNAKSAQINFEIYFDPKDFENKGSGKRNVPLTIWAVDNNANKVYTTLELPVDYGTVIAPSIVSPTLGTPIPENDITITGSPFKLTTDIYGPRHVATDFRIATEREPDFKSTIFTTTVIEPGNEQYISDLNFFYGKSKKDGNFIFILSDNDTLNSKVTDEVNAYLLKKGIPFLIDNNFKNIIFLDEYTPKEQGEELLGKSLTPIKIHHAADDISDINRVVDYMNEGDLIIYTGRDFIDPSQSDINNLVYSPKDSKDLILSTTLHLPKPLTKDTDYYFSIRYKDKYLGYSEWSKPVMFRVTDGLKDLVEKPVISGNIYPVVNTEYAYTITCNPIIGDEIDYFRASFNIDQTITIKAKDNKGTLSLIFPTKQNHTTQLLSVQAIDNLGNESPVQYQEFYVSSGYIFYGKNKNTGVPIVLWSSSPFISQDQKDEFNIDELVPSYLYYVNNNYNDLLLINTNIDYHDVESANNLHLTRCDIYDNLDTINNFSFYLNNGDIVTNIDYEFFALAVSKKETPSNDMELALFLGFSNDLKLNIDANTLLNTKVQSNKGFILISDSYNLNSQGKNLFLKNSVFEYIPVMVYNSDTTSELYLIHGNSTPSEIADIEKSLGLQLHRILIKDIATANSVISSLNKRGYNILNNSQLNLLSLSTSKDVSAHIYYGLREDGTHAGIIIQDGDTITQKDLNRVGLTTASEVYPYNKIDGTQDDMILVDASISKDYADQLKTKGYVRNELSINDSETLDHLIAKEGLAMKRDDSIFYIKKISLYYGNTPDGNTVYTLADYNYQFSKDELSEFNVESLSPATLYNEVGYNNLIALDNSLSGADIRQFEKDYNVVVKPVYLYMTSELSDINSIIPKNLFAYSASYRDTNIFKDFINSDTEHKVSIYDTINDYNVISSDKFPAQFITNGYTYLDTDDNIHIFNPSDTKLIDIEALAEITGLEISTVGNVTISHEIPVMSDILSETRSPEKK